MRNERKQEFKTISVRLPASMVQKLKTICIDMSQQEGRIVTLSEFLRGVLAPFCPQIEQLDLFEKNKSNKK